jgi:putative ABC transport system permease protein
MLTVTFADLRYRYRQFLIAVIGAGVVLAMGILLAGLADGFRAEINRTIGGVGADRWVLSAKANGRLTSVVTMPESAATKAATVPGVREASGLVLLPQEVARFQGAQVSVAIMGVEPRGIGSPAPDTGTKLAGSGQVVVDRSIKAQLGDQIKVGALSFTVVGVVHDRTLDGGMPVIYVTLHDSQRIGLGGLPLITAVVTKGTPAAVPAGLQSLNNSSVESSTLATLDSAISSIKNSRTMMWVVATIIVAALVYVSALQRVRDFAVLKAIGSSSRMLFASLCFQSVVVTLIAAGFGAACCNLLKGVFNQPVVIPTSAFVTLPIVGIVVGVLSSLVALRAATKADPVAAFGA